MDRNNPIAPEGKYRTVEDVSEIEADAFAMRYLGKSDYTARLKKDSSSQSYIDLVTNRAAVVTRNLWYLNAEGKPEVITVQTGSNNGSLTELLSTEDLEGKQVILRKKLF